MKNLIELTNIEMININGGGLVEDIGYAYHAAECTVKKAYHTVVDTVSGWFN
jgi:hypothetical protein